MTAIVIFENIYIILCPNGRFCKGNISASRSAILKHLNNVAYAIVAILHRFLEHTIACIENSGGQGSSVLAEL